MSDFDQLTAAAEPPSDFGQVSTGSPTDAPTANPITTRIATLAAVPGPGALDPASEEATRQALADGHEAQIRAEVALRTQQRQMGNLQRAMPDYSLNPETSAVINDSYNNLAQQSVADRSRASIEREAITRIQDELSTDPVEAQLTHDLIFGRGDISKVWYDEAAKNLVLAQKMQEYQKESENESYGGKVWNFLTGLVPFNDNFAHRGVLPDSLGGDTSGVKGFLLSGTAMQTQGEAFSRWMAYHTPEQLADALKTGGELDSAIRSNATTLFGYAPSSAAELMHELSYQSESDRTWSNAWSLGNAALFVPWGRIASVPQMLTRLGSRSLAADSVAQAVERMAAEGTEAAGAATAVSPREAIQNLELSAMHPTGATEHTVSLSTQIAERLDSVRRYVSEKFANDIQATRATTPEEISHMIEAGRADILETTGRAIKDYQVIHTDLRTGTETIYKVGDAIPEQGNSVMHIEATFGRQGGGGFASEKSALYNLGKSLGVAPESVNVVRDVSGQFFGKVRFALKEDGFITTSLQTPTDTLISAMRSDARRVDRAAHNKAIAGAANADIIRTSVVKNMQKSLKGLGGRDRSFLDEIIKKGQYDAKYYSRDEFADLWERSTGTEMSPKHWEAYDSYRFANDIAYVLRNDAEFIKWHTSGHENAKFTLGKTGLVYDDRAIISTSRPTDRVFNVSDNIQYNARNPLSEAEFDRLIGNGYVVAKTKGIKLPDGTKLSTVLIKRTELERSALKREQLAYSQGGSRDYGYNTHFVKQARTGIQPDTGTSYLENPSIFRAGRNPNELRRWAAIFNKALEDVRSGIRDPMHFEENVFANTEGLKFPTGKEFVEAIEDGSLNPKHDVGVYADREMPIQYQETSVDIENFTDPDETSMGGYYRSTGRLYTSGKGDHLLDPYGRPTETVDPWETTNTSLANISRITSLQAYKTNIVSRFKATYGKFIVGNTARMTDGELMRAGVGPNVPAELAGKIKTEQAAVRRILNFQTDFERKTSQITRNVANWVLGDAVSGPRVVAHDFVYWLQKNNPVNFIHGLAFDSKLGMFNPGQLILQSSTMLASVALSPRHGMKGMLGMPGLFAYSVSKGSEAVLDVMAKRSWKMAGFASEAEFKDFARFMDKTNFLHPDNTHLSINDFRPNRAFGAAGKIDGVRQMGRVFFYKAEVMNRSVAGRIAWEELKAKGLQPGTAQFRDSFMGLAGDYSFNMTHESSAAFQRGLWSIPTQFWGYNVRMMDAMFGSRFTAAQKARLISSQFLFFGAGGVPVIDSLADYLHHNDPDAKTRYDVSGIMGKLDRGAFDSALAALGVDVQVGEKLGTGAFLTNTFKDLFGMSEYGDKTPAEAITGATGSIAWSMGTTMKDVISWAAAESGTDQGFAITKDDILRTASNVSTLSNMTKAYLLYNYGIYRSNKGGTQVTGLPPADAFAVALGLNPQELATTGMMQDFITNRDTIVKEAATQVRNWRQEAFTIPDRMAENQRKVNFLLSTLPPSLRQEVVKRTNHITDDSFYTHIENKYNQERLEAESDGQSN